MTIDTSIRPANQASRSRSATAPVDWRADDVSLDAPERSPIRVMWPTAPTTQSAERPSTVSVPFAKFQTVPFRVTGLRKWEGKIVDVDGDTFTAELHPIDREGMPITADFDLDLFGSDAAAIVAGDVFYLSVRKVKVPGKNPERTESLRLRRLGRIRPEEVQAAYDRADALLENLEQLFD